MSMKNISLLIKKLNPICLSMLENATNQCAQSECYQVDIEHWLLCMIHDKKNSIADRLSQCQINLARLTLDLNNRCQHLKKGNTSLPTLSETLLTVIEDAWTIASVEYQQSQIAPVHIIAALFNNDRWCSTAERISTSFMEINREVLNEWLIEEQNKITDSSTQSASDDVFSQYTVDLTQSARLNQLDPIIGRDSEIRQLIDILSRRRQNNPILTGEAGVGKTAVVEGLAQRIVAHEVPANLQNSRLLSLDITALQAGASVKGEFERRLKALLDAIAGQKQSIILFADETHNLMGAGNQTGQGDAANLLKPALARGEIKMIGATTWSEYKKYIEPDAAFTRRFQTVKINEPDNETAIQMLYGIAANLEQHHQVTILSSALTNAVTLSRRYLTGRQLPDKAVSLLDTTCARVRLSQAQEPIKIEKLRYKLQSLNLKIGRIEHENNQLLAKHQKIKMLSIKKDEYVQLLKTEMHNWQKAKKNLAEISKLRKSLGVESISNSERKQIKIKLAQLQKKRLGKDNQAMIYDCVDASVIAAVLADWTGIPIGKMLQKDADRMLSLEEELSNIVVGQSLATNMLAQHLQTTQANLQDPNKPRGVFLMVGGSGVGKTQTAQALADLLYGGRDHMIVINMSEFKEPHKISMLTGSPPGYVGYGSGGVLTEAVRRQPYSVILLDEMEKAHVSVQELFYQVFDQGVMMDGEGRQIDFRNTLILMASNVCDDLLLELTEKKQDYKFDQLNQAIMPALLESFKPAFLGRVTTLPYFALSQEVLCEIAKYKLSQVVNRVSEQHKIKLSFAPTFIDDIVTSCQQQATGARQIDQFIQQKLLPYIAKQCLSAVIKKQKLKDIIIGKNFISEADSMN